MSESSEARGMGWIESDEGWVLPLLRGEEFGEADKKGGLKDWGEGEGSEWLGKDPSS